MKKRLLVALLAAATTMPADALTVVAYRGSGLGTFTDYFGSSKPVWAYAEIHMPSNGECSMYSQCQIRGNMLRVETHVFHSYGMVELAFDHALSAWPLTSEGFVSGSGIGGRYEEGTVSVGFTRLHVWTYETDEESFQASAGVWSNFAPVPEPASWAMMLGGLGLTGLALRRKRRRVHFSIS